MKRRSYCVICLLIMALCVAFFVACSANHNHQFGDYTVIREATCANEGIKIRKCNECGEEDKAFIPATGDHQFGDWMIQSGVEMHYCIYCNYAESKLISDVENPSDEKNDVHSYGNFDYFLRDCDEVGHSIEYTGTSNKIIVSLENGTNEVDNHTIILPSRVTDVTFLGNVKGDDIYGLKINIAKRVTDINITFHNVRIATNGTIFTSETNNIKVSVTMKGEKCSFKNTSVGEHGRNGEYREVNGGESGGRGGDGSPAFYVNGECVVYCQSKELTIIGGNGGTGGNGGDSGLGTPANGGDGGNGGKAINGENIVNVYVSVGCTTNICGGTGGNGGKGGTSMHWGMKTGPSGAKGRNGDAGCKILNK